MPLYYCGEEWPSDSSRDSSSSTQEYIDLCSESGSDENGQAMDQVEVATVAAPGPIRRSRSREPTGGRSRGWCFTINNPEMSHDELARLLTTTNGFEYLVFQLERGTESSAAQSHFQGYVYFKQPKAFNTIKRLLGRAHLEAAQGTARQNEEYCTKEETRQAGPWRYGQLPAQGKRSDIAAAAQALMDGKSLSAVSQEFPEIALKYGSGMYKFTRTLPPPPLDHPKRVFLFIGPPGTGKTRMATSIDFDLDKGPNEQVYLKNPDEWFDFYQGQDTVVLDDFVGSASKFSLAMTLRILDRYRMPVPVKGSYEWWIPKTVVLTTNVHPKSWYKWTNRESQLDALARRFCEIRIFGQDCRIRSLTTTWEILDFFVNPVAFGYQEPQNDKDKE